jgi:4'-phosphopantetheinyl transferase
MPPIPQPESIRCYFDPVHGNETNLIKDPAEVYFSLTDELAGSYRDLEKCLGKEEQARAARFLHETDRATYTSCHAMLRLILGRRLEKDPRQISFLTGAYNKPRLECDPVYFNITHTGKAFAIVVSESCETGIDMESVSRTMNFNGIIKNFFSVTESEFILKDPAESSSMFFMLWTRKEALLKALGTGIADNLPGVEVSRKENHIRKESFENMVPDSAFKEHFIYSFKYLNYYLSVAFPGVTTINFNHLTSENIFSFFD